MTVYFFGVVVVEFLFEIVCYGAGKVLVPVITFGRVRTQGDHEDISFRWHGIARGTDGKIVLSAETTSLCGLAILLLVFGLVIYTAITRSR